MERDPGKINLVRIRLHQHREMEGEVTNLKMLDGAWPDEVQASQLIDDGAPDIHPEKGIGVAVCAAGLSTMRSVTASHAEVADLATGRRRWADLAGQPAGGRHWASASKPPSA
jgi:hypothetical protein